MRFASFLPFLAVSPVLAGSLEDGKLTRRELIAIERSIYERGLVEDIWNKIKNAATCTGCQGILLLLKGIAALGDDAFIGAAQGLCKLAKVQDDDVCDGAVELEGPSVANAIRNMKLGSRTSKLFCGSLIGLCELPKPQPWTIEFPSPKPAGGRPVPSGKEPLKIVHYSDIHIDPQYLPGSNTQCNKPICCRAYTEDDAPGNTKNPAGPNGDHKCDTPVSLEESMYKAISELVPDVSFAVFTGDIVDHTIWNTSKPYNEAEINNAYMFMDKYLNIVYGTAGNHEQHPANLFQPNSLGSNAQWVYDLLGQYWPKWTGEATTDDIVSQGTYAAKFPGGKLRVISLNTNMYYKLNFELYQRTMQKDPNGQWTWLVKELDAAEKAGDRVYIIGHMPMGDGDAFYDGSNYFDQIVNRYSNTIAAMFFGHTHVDHFEISYSDYSKRNYANARAVAYISPSLTPTSGMPTFRVYEVDPDTFAVLDTVQYMADMSNPEFQTTGPVWTKYYSAKEVYGSVVNPPVTDASAELSPAFWHNVTEAFEANSTLFDAYMARKSRGWKPASCTGDCKKNELCQLRAGRSQDNCYKLAPGSIGIAKRELNSEKGMHDDCDASVGLETIGHLGDSKEMLELLQEKFIELNATLETSFEDIEMEDDE